MVGQSEETKPLPGFQLDNWGMTVLLPEEEATGYREEAGWQEGRTEVSDLWRTRRLGGESRLTVGLSGLVLKKWVGFGVPFVSYQHIRGN